MAPLTTPMPWFLISTTVHNTFIKWRAPVISSWLDWVTYSSRRQCGEQKVVEFASKSISFFFEINRFPQRLKLADILTDTLTVFHNISLRISSNIYFCLQLGLCQKYLFSLTKFSCLLRQLFWKCTEKKNNTTKIAMLMTSPRKVSGTLLMP